MIIHSACPTPHPRNCCRTKHPCNLPPKLAHRKTKSHTKKWYEGRLNPKYNWRDFITPFLFHLKHLSSSVRMSSSSHLESWEMDIICEQDVPCDGAAWFGGPCLHVGWVGPKFSLTMNWTIVGPPQAQPSKGSVCHPWLGSLIQVGYRQKCGTLNQGVPSVTQ